MRRLRLTIAQLMSVIFFVGFGVAALRNANEFWASATFSLAIVTVSVTVAGASARQGGARMPWVGFAVAGGSYLVIWLLAGKDTGFIYGSPRSLLHALRPYINPEASGGAELIAYVQTCRSLEAGLLGLIGAILSCLAAPKH